MPASSSPKPLDHLTAGPGPPDCRTDVRIDALVHQHHVDLVEGTDERITDQADPATEIVIYRH